MRLDDLLGVEQLAAPEGVQFLHLDELGAIDERTGERAASALFDYPGVVIGVARRPLDRSGAAIAPSLTTTLTHHDIGRVGVVVDDVARAMDEIQQHGGSAPVAARVLSQVVRLGAGLSLPHGIWVESLAYSALLGGEEFAEWRRSTPARQLAPSSSPVLIDRVGDLLDVRLSRPERHNALDAAARQALAQALDVAIADPALSVQLSGEGPSFCSGGDLEEFGQATDLAAAHLLRVELGPARRMAVVAERTRVVVHGACIGAGIELAAFAGHVIARPDATFALPELGMGLIPGSGGTISIPRRIGRWRAAWWVLSGAGLDVDIALDWGLIDEIA